MANSPSHRFGQIVGEVLESAVTPLLETFAIEHNLYLDKKGERPCRKGKKCGWVDLNGNTHDLDFVLERGGSASKLGVPAAFIEVAWRRYTKHSRNKAQEIQGAIIPLAETFQNANPFKGAILAGVFTQGAITQLESLGFTLLYIPYESIVNAFGRFGIDARFDQKTPDDDFQQKVDSYEELASDLKNELANELLRENAKEVSQFIAGLSEAVLAQIERIIVLPLHGVVFDVASVEEAIDFINGYDESSCRDPLVKYEIQIRYNNGNLLTGTFHDKPSAVKFLDGYRIPTP